MSNRRIAIIAEGSKAIPLIQALEGLVISVYYTREPSDELKNFVKEKGLTISKFSLESKYPYDLVLLFECHVIIPESLFRIGRWVNVHSGILPKWRGYSANSWALLNDEPFLGFTLHEVAREFDSGPVIKQYIIENDFESSYFDLRSRALTQLYKDIRETISNYLMGVEKEEIPLATETNPLYCSVIRKEDGYIYSFSRDATWYCNLSRLFTHNGISDLFLKHEGEFSKIKRIESCYNEYIGFENRILVKESNRCMVSTSNGSIWVHPENMSHFVALLKRINS